MGLFARDYKIGDDTVSQEFDNYERFLRRELPRLVRRQLEVVAAELSAPVGEPAPRSASWSILSETPSLNYFSATYRGSTEPAAAGAAAGGLGMASPVPQIAAPK